MPRKAEPSLRNRIRDLRLLESEITQQALADHIGVTRQTVVALEAQGYAPSLALALRIARFFDRSVEEIFWIDA